MIKTTAFSGIAPRYQSRLLPDNAAQIADNCRLLSGAIESWMKPISVEVDAAAFTVQSIYKMTDGQANYWLKWARDVSCVPSLIAGDEAQRIYYTGDAEPRISNFALATSGANKPTAFFVLGVPAPLVAPTVTPTGGVGAASTRAYVETFVTPWGEEGSISPASVVTTGKVDDTWTISALNAAPINTAAITAATHSAGVVTVTTASTAYLRAGEEVSVAGVAGMTDLNATHTVTQIVDATHFKVALTTAQTYTSGGAWTRVAPHNTAGMTRRIYRSIAGAFLFVAELPIATTSYVDAVADTDLGEVCPSIGWDMPPADMIGLASHPMGFLIGVAKNEICFSDPWHPHAWPAAYRQSTKFNLVGLGVFGSGIVACTTGTPYILSGAHPDSISMEQTEVVEPCLSRRGIVEVGDGVMYTSPNGLIHIGIGGANLVTKELIALRDWKTLQTANMQLAFYNGMVVGMSPTWNAQNHSGFVFDGVSRTFTSLSIKATAVWSDPQDGKIYIVVDDIIKEWNADTNNNETFDWKSKVFSFPNPINLGWAKVDADYGYLRADQTAQIAAQAAIDFTYNTAQLAIGITKGELDGAMLGEFTLGGSLLRGGVINDYTTRFLRLSIFADGELKYTRPVTDEYSFPLPSGYTETQYEYRVSGNVPVYSVYLGRTRLEVQQ